MRGSISTAAAVMGAGNGLFPGNAGLDFAVKVADLTGDLGQAGCGMVFVAGKRLGLEPVQQRVRFAFRATLATCISMRSRRFYDTGAHGSRSTAIPICATIHASTTSVLARVPFD